MKIAEAFERGEAAVSHEFAFIGRCLGGDRFEYQVFRLRGEPPRYFIEAGSSATSVGTREEWVSRLNGPFGARSCRKAQIKVAGASLPGLFVDIEYLIDIELDSENRVRTFSPVGRVE
jgi:hypothetical protein